MLSDTLHTVSGVGTGATLLAAIDAGATHVASAAPNTPLVLGIATLVVQVFNTIWNSIQKKRQAKRDAKSNQNSQG